MDWFLHLLCRCPPEVVAHDHFGQNFFENNDVISLISKLIGGKRYTQKTDEHKFVNRSVINVSVSFKMVSTF